MITPARLHHRRWNPWYWDLPLAALAGMVAISLLHANETLFLGCNRLSAWTGDRFWADVTLLGDTLIAMTLFLPLVRRWPQMVWAGLLAGLLATLWVHGCKYLLPLPRPAAVLPRDQFHIIGKALVAASFPSGHTTTALTAVGVIILHLAASWRQWLSGPLLLLGGLIGLSRLVVGAHWPLDVLGGMVSGWLAAVLGTFWAQRWPWGSTPSGRLCLTVLLIGCALFALLFHKTGYPQSDGWRVVLVLLCLGAVVYQFWMERRERDAATSSRIDPE